jgi:DNA-binding response OmpR family regulator
MNIGVLDDNPTILAYLETALEMDGHTVYRHMTGESMLQAMQPESNLPYDLVVLDLLLRGRLSGADVFLTLRKQYPSWQLPIIVITAVSGPTLDQFRRILPDDVPLLRKPFTPRELRRLIRELGARDNT